MLTEVVAVVSFSNTEEYSNPKILLKDCATNSKETESPLVYSSLVGLTETVSTSALIDKTLPLASRIVPLVGFIILVEVC